MIRVLLFLSAISSASALTLPLSGVATRVRSHHPMLKAARMAVDEARGRQLGSGRLANPTFGYDFQNQSNVSPQTSVFSLDQSFPITRRLSLEKKLTSQLVTAAELEVRDAERRFIAEARSIAVRLLALDSQRNLRQKQITLANKLSEFVKSRAEQGELSPLDASQAQLDAQRLLVESRLLDNERLSLLGTLKPMIGLPPVDELTVSGELGAPSAPHIRSVWTQRADYQLAQTKVAAAQTDKELARARRLPDVTAGFFASREMQDVTPTSRERTGFLGFRISIPLPFWNRNEGEIAEKKAAAERHRLEADALGKQIASEADTARREMQANADLARETRDKLLPLVVEQAARIEQAYESGQTDMLTVLRAREQRLQMEAAAVDAVRDFHLARIRYEAAIGVTKP